MKLITILVLLSLTGCAGLLAPVGNMFDAMDKCQTKSRSPGEPLPDYCGASAGRTISINRSIAPNTYIITTR